MGDLILVLYRSEAQQAALESLNVQQYDPASPEYHQWLTPAEFGATYGVAESDLEAVTDWLESQGFTINEISASRTSIRFSGNVGQVEAAFHTEIHSITSGGVAHIANVSDISIPTALTPVVVGVKALHNFFPRPQHHKLSQLGLNSSGQMSPLSGPGDFPRANKDGGLIAGPTEVTGMRSLQPHYSPGDGYQLLVPYDMATIYNYKSLWTASTPINGTGQTVALAGTSNIVLSDVATFRSATGLPAKVPTVIVTNSDPGTTNLLDDRMENTLDVEWSGAAAPGASIVLVTSSQTSQTTDALYASESYIINNNVAKIMSVSYGECELGMGTAGNQEYSNLWQQAYTQGIAVFVSSGDSMAAVCDDGYYNPSADYAVEFGLTVSGMTSTPYNVSVGGTDFNSTSANWGGSNSSPNMSNAVGYIPEVPWNDTVTNPILISDFDGQLGVNYSAEKWANWLLANEGIGGGLYEEVIPPTGGSGGVSNCTTSNGSTPSSCGGGYAKPSWQTGVTGIVSSDKRTVPDVSFFASNGFLGVTYLICDSQPPGFDSPIACSYPANALDMAVGGTSVSSPVMAGVMALINQKAGASQGNPNSVLYGLAAKQSYGSCSAESATNSGSCYFNDIDTGTIAAVCYGGTTNCTPQTSGDALGILPGYAATAGYDKATGLGSLNVANVVNGWPKAATSAPASSLSATSLTFSSTPVGAIAATQAVTLTNSGGTSLTLSGVSITGTNFSSFSQTNTCGTTLAASASCAVTVTFKPAATGTLSAAISFADNAANSPQTVALQGTGVAATTSISASPTSLTFPSTAIGTASAMQTVTLTNTGSTTITLTSSPTITGIYGSLFHGASSCAGSLTAGASCLTNFTFNPTAAGTFTATLSFNDSAPGSPQTVTLSGTSVTAPAVSLSPTSLTFASTNIGSSSAAQAITLKNTGTAVLTISGISLTGSGASAYAQTNTCSTSLAVSASCTISVTFKPTAVGAASASLSLADNATGSPQTVALSGTGAGIPTVSLSPTSLTFASTNVGSSSAAQAVTLKNTGTGALTVSNVSLTGSGAAAYAQTSTCGTSLVAGGSCSISVTFNPTAVGAAAASLSLADNATGTPQTVALSGTGVGVPVVSLSPASLSFASTLDGSSSAAQAVTLKNTGTAALTITGASFTGTGASAYAQTNTCGTSLATSASCTITVTFKPSTAGTLTASLSLADNATGSPQTVALTGVGVAPQPAVQLSVASLSFPITVVNPSPGYASSPAQAITLTNSGTGALTLTSIALGGTNPTSFTQMNNCPGTLAVSASCTVLASFAPTALGSRSATLVFTDNANPTTQSVSLSGTGVSAPPWSLSTTSLSYGTVKTGTISAAQVITVTNSSTTTPVNLTSIALSGTGAASFAKVSSCGTTLAASSSCIVQVEFTPTAAGATTATLTVTANNPAVTATVTLSGTGQ
jgi:subtilase family serine protease